MLSASIRGMSAYQGYREYCKFTFKNFDSGLCANLMTSLQPLSSFDKFQYLEEREIYFDYSSKVSLAPEAIITLLSKSVIYIGLLVHMCEIRIAKKQMLFMVIFGTLLFSLPKLTRPLHRFNKDYLGYINQAS
jgi:hypothetical protein